jgi:uncharacterized Fe-S cluster protein YjdI
MPHAAQVEGIIFVLFICKHAENCVRNENNASGETVYGTMNTVEIVQNITDSGV